MKSKSFAGSGSTPARPTTATLVQIKSSSLTILLREARRHTERCCTNGIVYHFISISSLLTCRTCHLPVQCLPNRFRCCGITLYSLHKNHKREREIRMSIYIYTYVYIHYTHTYMYIIIYTYGLMWRYVQIHADMRLMRLVHLSALMTFDVFWCIWLILIDEPIVINSHLLRLPLQELFKKFDKDGNGRPLAWAGVTCVADRFNGWTDWLYTYVILCCFNNLSPKMIYINTFKHEFLWCSMSSKGVYSASGAYWHR